MTFASAARRSTAVALLLAPGCVGVLDLDDYQDAVQQLCKCDLVVPQFGEQCIDVLTTRLDGVSEGTRAAWLDFFATECAGNCDNAFACYQQDATCSDISCTEDIECCRYAEGMRCARMDGAAAGECKFPGDQ